MIENTASRSQAIRRLFKKARPLEAVLIPPHEALGLVASHNITAFCDVPEMACSVRDGYAVRTEDIEKSGPMKPVRLSVTQTIRAEAVTAAEVNKGEAARVLTGGMVPPGCDAVLAEEDVEMDGDTIFVRTPVRSGWFVRQAGGEIKLGSVITRAGNIITPQASAVMIRTRSSSVHVHPAPRAKVVALGSELSNPMCCGEECDTARFPADNLIMASGLLAQSGARVVETDVLPDIEERLVEMLSQNDLPEIIVTTGGTGPSERDFARTGAEQAGFTPIFDRLDIRPGRNMFAAHRDNTLLFSLPGPPAAVFACFHTVILPTVRRMRGLPDLAEPIMARFEEGLSARPGGEWIVLCTLKQKGSSLVATPLTSKDAPPMLAMGQAHGVAVLKGGDSILPGGETEILSTRF